jgi:hypothetical protein
MKYHAVLYSQAATDPKSGVVNRFLGSISQIPAYFPVGGREGVKNIHREEKCGIG